MQELESAGFQLGLAETQLTEPLQHSLQLTAQHKVSTPANWQQGDDVIIAGSVSNDEAKELFGEWEEPKPYIRIVPDPSKVPA